ncbi:MAG: hypothetical protein GC178_05660 [Flavobacteriales bacterium]|nr:hypothetical protein [Flavobacteriales bacterium]
MYYLLDRYTFLIRPLVLIMFTFFKTSNYSVWAQGPALEWVGVMVNGEREMDSYAMTVDDEGSVITMGYFLGIVDMDPGPSEYLLETDFTYTDIFIQKLDSSGNFQWAAQFGGNLPDGSISPPAPFDNASPIGGAVKADSVGNLFLVVGFMSDSVDVDPGPGVNYIYRTSPFSESGWEFDYAVIKLDPEGNFIWAHSFGGTMSEYVSDAEVDSDGNLYVAGSFQDSVDFDPSPANSSWLLADGTQSGFIQKFNGDGELLWVKQMGSPTGYAIVSDIETDAFDNLLLVGTFTDTFDFDLGLGVFEMIGMVDTVALSTFVVKYDSDLNFHWAKQLPTGGKTSMTLHSGGSIAIACEFATGNEVTVDIDPSPISQFFVSNNGIYGFYIVKLNMDGGFIWGGSIDSYFYNLQYEQDEGLVLAIELPSVVDIDPGPEFYVPDSTDFVGATFLRLRPDNSLDWARSVGYLKPFHHEQLSMEVDDSNNIYISSGFIGTVDVDPSPADTFNIDWGGTYWRNYDIFVLKWSQPDISVNVLTEMDSAILAVYPNPSTGQFVIDFGDSHERGIYRVVDQFGRVVQSGSCPDGQYCEIYLDVRYGTFICTVNTESNSYSFPIIIY